MRLYLHRKHSESTNEAAKQFTLQIAELFTDSADRELLLKELALLVSHWLIVKFSVTYF